jgi:hypothetical protein
MALLLTLAVTPAHASPSKGTMMAFPVVPPRTGTMFSDLEFRGSEPTTIVVTGQGGNVDCTVFNDKSSIVASDDGPANSCKFLITPKVRSKYTLLVTNVDPKQESKVSVLIQ